MEHYVKADAATNLEIRAFMPIWRSLREQYHSKIANHFSRLEVSVTLMCCTDVAQHRGTRRPSASKLMTCFVPLINGLNRSFAN